MRLFWLAVLTAHGTAAVAWWWLLPGGFPVGHPRFWVNEALPIGVLGMVVAVRFLAWGNERARNSVLATFPVFWLAVAIGGRVIFPESGRWLFIAPLALGLAMLAMLWIARPRPARWALAVVPLVALLGVLMPLAERGVDPDTRPLRATMPAIPDPLLAPAEMRSIVLGPEIRLDPGDPVVTLAQGRMNRTDPLTMTLYDQDRAVFELTLHDWAAQAGVQLSPTAGYRLPVNAIEFSIDGDTDRAQAGVWITLAATSVGRGWDTVGHAAGTYRNRVTVRRVDERH